MKLIIPNTIHKKLFAFVNMAKGEVAGFMDVEFDPTQESFIAGDIYLLEQEATTGDVEMKEESIAKLMEELIAQGKTQMPQLYWHSHGSMGVFFSGTDTQTIAESKNDSFTVSMVVNRSYQTKAQVNLWKPFPMQEDLEVVLEQDKIPDEWVEEFVTKVKEEVFHYQGTPYNSKDTKKQNGKKNRKEEKEYKPIYLTFPRNRQRILEIIAEHYLEYVGNDAEGHEVWASSTANTEYHDVHDLVPVSVKDFNDARIEATKPILLTEGEEDDEYQKWLKGEGADN